jgi:predicted transcriptional regulator of viral defense system
MNLFNNYVKKLRASGRRYFTLNEAITELGIKKENLLACVYRLKKKGELFSPAKGLYIMIPSEHYNLGSVPAAELVPILMQYWNLNYYAGLTTAAMYYGSSHQKPQVFQIILDKQIHRPLIFGQIKIECVYKKSFTNLPTQERITETGYLKISSPELTAVDLLLYPSKAGGLNNIATILTELIEVIDPDKLIMLIDVIKEKSWIQRLGYILDNIDALDENKKEILINKLQDHLKLKKLFYLSLVAEEPILGASYCKKWMIIENLKIEQD